MYKFLRNLLFLLPPETAHYFSMNVLKLASSVGPLRKSLARQFIIHDPRLSREVFGLKFRNPVGLGAGFDKNAKYLRELDTLGFGFIEIGTVTPRPQHGNERPRLFRLPKDKALINRMGFNNEGVEAAARRLKAWRKTAAPSALLIGGNIGKNKSTPNEEAWKDYEICFRTLHPFVDFFVVNVSSPNTPGLRELQGKEALKKILVHLQTMNRQFDIQRPILLKIAPDLDLSQVDDVVELAKEINLDGLVTANTTIDRAQLLTSKEELEAIGAGGLSGQPLRQRSTELVRYIHQKHPAMPLIASGGIFDGNSTREKLEAGASLVEVWTGFIYEGPLIAKRICQDLL